MLGALKRTKKVGLDFNWMLSGSGVNSVMGCLNKAYLDRGLFGQLGQCSCFV